MPSKTLQKKTMGGAHFLFFFFFCYFFSLSFMTNSEIVNRAIILLQPGCFYHCIGLSLTDQKEAEAGSVEEQPARNTSGCLSIVSLFFKFFRIQHTFGFFHAIRFSIHVNQVRLMG